jgi:hypothetical protein
MADHTTMARITSKQVEKADALAIQLRAKSFGANVSRSHVIRLAIDEGLAVLAKKLEEVR